MIFAELKRLYDQPLFDLISQSRAVHLEYWWSEQVQRCGSIFYGDKLLTAEIPRPTPMLHCFVSSEW